MPYAIVSHAVLLVPLALATGADDQASAKGKRRPAADRPQEGTLKLGDEAPNFKLKKLNADDEIELASYRGRPVVLIFGSYT